MNIYSKLSIELLDWVREDLENEKLDINFKKAKRIMDISIKYNKKHRRFFKPSSFYKYHVKENRLYYYYNCYYMSGVIRENYEVILK